MNGLAWRLWRRVTRAIDAAARRLPDAWLTERLGEWEYRLGSEWKRHWGAEPLNGQEARRRLVREMCEHLRFVAVVETGTFRGATAAFLHEATGAPLHSFEADARFHGFARARLRGLAAVHLHRGDSRDGLARLAAEGALPAGTVLFYLDAHGQIDLPLAEEIEIAFRHWPDAVVMIDDFAVPDDPGYGFDDYGESGALSLAYLDANGVPTPAVWLPRCASAAETGSRRGCVVLARAPALIGALDVVEGLRRWDA